MSQFRAVFALLRLALAVALLSTVGVVMLIAAQDIANPPGAPAGAATNPGGYRMVGADGSVFSFVAGRFGSLAGQPLNQPIVGMATTPDGQGYWLVARDGGIFSFGDAAFFGSTGAITLNQPIVGMARTSDSSGYWMVAADGGVFSFGDAGFHGSAAGLPIAGPIVAISADVVFPPTLASCGACGLVGPINADRATQNLQPVVAFNDLQTDPAEQLTAAEVANIKQREQNCALNWDGTHCGGGENEATISLGQSGASNASEAGVVALQEWFGEGPGGGHYANVMFPQATSVMVAIAFHPNGTAQAPGAGPCWVVIAEF